MSRINIFNKIKEGSGELIGKVKFNIGDAVENSSGKPSLKVMKSERAVVLQDKQKYLGYLGMTTYELYKEKKISSLELEGDYLKLLELDKALENLDKTIESLEKLNQSKQICECGCKITGKDQFCPSCGKKIPSDIINCTCGNVLKKNQKFCPSCGKSIDELMAAESGSVEAVKWRECICGAKIAPGQFMCMECGRPVE